MANGGLRPMCSLMPLLWIRCSAVPCSHLKTQCLRASSHLHHHCICQCAYILHDRPAFSHLAGKLVLNAEGSIKPGGGGNGVHTVCRLG